MDLLQWQWQDMAFGLYKISDCEKQHNNYIQPSVKKKHFPICREYRCGITLPYLTLANGIVTALSRIPFSRSKSVIHTQVPTYTNVSNINFIMPNIYA